MFITNQLTPAELLSELLTRKRSQRRDTAAFSQRKHDKDLCPIFQDNISAILDVYKAHSTRTYDIQGLRDRGIDILIKLEDAPHDIGIQVKSFDEIELWAKGKNPTFIQGLKAQYSDATQTRNINPFYIALCTDSQKHVKQIRSVAAEFGQFDRARILRPEECFAFCQTAEHALAGAAALLLCEEDGLLQMARSEFSGQSEEVSWVVLALMGRAFSPGNTNQQLRVSDEELLACFERQDEQDTLRDEIDVIATIDELVGRGYLIRDSPGHVIDITAFSTALLAVCLGEAARAECGLEEIRPYLGVLLGL